MAEREQPLLNAFVGRSFLPQDEALWVAVRALLESFAPLGFAFEDAGEAQPHPVSKKVRLGIERNDVYIGILSRRDRLVDRAGFVQRAVSALFHMGQRWCPSSWVVQESGYALGMNKRVVLMIEEGVDFPTSNLDADREWIAFRRDSIHHILTRLNTVLGHLLRERLPASPAAEVPLDQSVVAPDATPSEEPSPPATDAMDAILSHLDRGEFMEADRAYETWVRDTLDGPFKEWFGYHYRFRQATAGDRSGLEWLRTRLSQRPDDVDARIHLARYFSHFDQPLEAARILLEGNQRADAYGRERLTLRAADAYAKAGRYEEAVRTLTALLRDNDERARVFSGLADIAKEMGNAELETAALERVLALDPGQGSTRFRLAYAYSHGENPALAMYHYKVRLSQGADGTASNNLGVAYEKLKLPSKEVESYLAAAANDNALARANLGHAYADRGFLAEAQRVASEVLANQPEDVERTRAAGALRRVKLLRGQENEKEERITHGARRESEFRARYADAYMAEPVQITRGQYQTPRHGTLTIEQDGARIAGAATVREAAPASLLGSLMVAGPFATHGGRMQTRTVTFEGTVVRGRAGTFKLTTEVSRDSLVPVPDTDKSETKGLLVVAPGGNALEILEKGEDVGKIYEATLTQSAALPE